MSKSFDYVLTTWLENKNISRKELIAILQNNHYEIFKGLDSITLSRWLTGKTVPSLYKQLLIARILDIDLVEAILAVDISKAKFSRKDSGLLEQLKEYIDYSLVSLAYSAISKNPQLALNHTSKATHFSEFSDFYNNLSALSDFYGELSSLQEDVIVTTIELQHNEKLVGHWSGFEDLSFTESIPSFPNLSKNEIDEGALINVGFYSNSAHNLQLMTASACYFLLNKRYHNKNTVYGFATGKTMAKLYVSLFDMEVIKVYPSKIEHHIDVYLIKGDLLKLLSHPMLLIPVKDQLETFFSGKSSSTNHFLETCTTHANK